MQIMQFLSMFHLLYKAPHLYISTYYIKWIQFSSFSILFITVFLGEAFSCLCASECCTLNAAQTLCRMNSGLMMAKICMIRWKLCCVQSIILLMSLDRLFCTAPSGSCCTNCSHIVQRLFSNLFPCEFIFQICPFDICAEIANATMVFALKNM